MGSSWYRSKWVVISSAAILLLVIVVQVAPLLISVDSFRPLLVSVVESRSGRKIQIDKLELYLVPTVRIRVVNFRMKNPYGFPAGDALIAKSIDLGIDPRALLSRRLDVTYIAPDGVQINVLRDATGRSNFAAPVPPRNAVPSQPLFTIERIGSINVKDAAINFGDAPGRKQPVPSFSLSGLSGKINSIDPQAQDWAKVLDIVADLRGAKLSTLLLAEPVDFHTGAFTFKGGAGRGTFSASASSVNLAGSAGFARLDPLSITFSVAAPELNLNTLATLVRTGEKRALSTAHKLLAHGTIKIGRVVYAPLEGTNLSGQLSIYANAIHLDSSTLSAYGGSVRESAALNGSAGVPTAVSAEVSGLDVQSVLAALGVGSGRVTGTLDADFNLSTLLANDPKEALTAAGTFSVHNGSFPGMDVNGDAAQAARIASLNVPSGDTRFSYLGGDMRIAHERGSSNQVNLVASGMQATLHGDFAFDQTLNYSGTAVLDTLTQTSSAGSPLLAAVGQIVSGELQRYLGGTRVQVPFTVHGTLANPQFKVAGTPQLLLTQSQPQSTQQLTIPTAAQDLIRLIPGLHL